ncbi:MAG: GNAT family protein [Ilumatobacteraceae bacterium]
MARFADKPTINGERITLRPIAASDTEHMWSDAHDVEITYFTGSHGEFTHSQIEQWCTSRVDQPDRLDMAAVDAETGEWLGEVVINEWDPDNRSCSFRIALSANARDRGIGTEATQLIVDYVFDEIDEPAVNRISLEVYDFNPRGLAVYEKVGFLPEGVLRDALFWKEEFHDAITMSVLRRDRDRKSHA